MRAPADRQIHAVAGLSSCCSTGGSLAGGGVCHGPGAGRAGPTGSRRQRRGRAAACRRRAWPRCRCDVLAQAYEYRSPQRAARRHSLKVTSATSWRFQPVRGPMQRRRIGKRRVAGRLSFAAAARSAPMTSVVETGADVSGVAQRLALAEAEQQGAQRLARALARV